MQVNVKRAVEGKRAKEDEPEGEANVKNNEEHCGVSALLQWAFERNFRPLSTTIIPKAKFINIINTIKHYHHYY